MTPRERPTAGTPSTDFLSTVASPRPAPFVGRQDEFNRIAHSVEEAVAGHGVVVVVEGEPGIGKTALLDAVRRHFRSRKVKILSGRGALIENQVPFTAIASCFESKSPSEDVLMDRARALLRSEGPAEGAASREFAVSEALLTVIDGLCARGPVALAVDDLQWADAASLLVIRRLAAGITQLPLLMLVAVRPVPRDESLAAVLRELGESGATWLRLNPLDEPAVAALTEDVAGAPAGPGLRTIVATAGGNPLYVTELVAGLRQAGEILLSEGIAEQIGTSVDGEDATITLPRTLTDTILRRLDFLPVAARQILSMAAALGPEIEAYELSTVLGVSVLEVWNAVSLALETGLLAHTEHRLGFRHDLIRQAFARQVPDDTRRALQARAAHALIETGASAENIALFLVASRTTLDQPCLTWLTRDADTLIVRAPDLAVSLLDSALTTARLPKAARAALCLHQVRALLWSGRAARAEAAARTALAAHSLDPTADGALRWLLAQACHGQGRLRDAITESRNALALPSLAPQEQGQIHGFMALTYCFLEDFTAAEKAAEKAISIGRIHDDPVAGGFGYMGLGGFRLCNGQLDDALTMADKVIDAYNTGVQAGKRFDQFDPYLLRSHCLIELDRTEDAHAALDAANRFCLDNHGTYLAPNLLARARLMYVTGDWDDALAELDALHEAPDTLGYDAPGQTLAAIIHMRRGQITERPTIPAQDSSMGARAHSHFHPWAHALIAEAEEDAGASAHVLVDIICQPAPVLNVFLHHAIPDAARLVYSIGDRAGLEIVTAKADAIAEVQSTPSRRGAALLCHGLLENRPDLLAEATQQFRQAGYRLLEAQTQENLAVLLAADGQTGPARETMEAAIELYDQFGAETDSARTLSRLRRLGVRRGTRGSRQRPKTGLAALTVTEQKVAKFVALGMSNSDIATQMYLSRRTVQTHVSNILNKLDLRSRIQIAISLG
ncbi:helix-turn-helix transcriptional regulator [Nocardia alni]|uniref:helix-turn-helix transcriptional regulator n=1 Tax=Nocardia alni TaxID=2815723 RepID=UPI001C2253DB|nr:LuxR family transcriptional regulator [Nocardia alni]